MMPSKPLTKLYSLRGRLLLTIIGIATFFWIVSCAIMVYVAWDETNDMFDDALKKSAALLLQSTHSEWLQTNNSSKRFKDKKPDKDDLHYQILYQGQVVSKTSDAPLTPFVAEFIAHKGFSNIMLNGQKWRIYIIRDKKRAIEVQVGQALEMRLEILEELAEDLIVPALVLLLALGLISASAIYYLLKPLAKMAADLSSTSVHGLEKVVIHSRSKELTAIGYALNDLLARLNCALTSERRFTADAAHELRTPLAALGMEAQLLQRLYPQMTNALQKFRKDIERTTNLVGHLLLLARLDPLDSHDQNSLMKTNVSLSPLFDTLQQLYLDQAQEKSISLHFNAQLDVIYASEELLKIALRNLIDNALRYIPEGGVVTVCAFKVGHYGILEVKDNGPGVSDDEVTKITQRFYRVLGNEAAGSGLGLSIVERIVILHQGALEINSGPGCVGLHARIKLALVDK